MNHEETLALYDAQWAGDNGAVIVDEDDDKQPMLVLTIPELAIQVPDGATEFEVAINYRRVYNALSGCYEWHFRTSDLVVGSEAFSAAT